MYILAFCTASQRGTDIFGRMSVPSSAALSRLFMKSGVLLSIVVMSSCVDNGGAAAGEYSGISSLFLDWLASFNLDFEFLGESAERPGAGSLR